MTKIIVNNLSMSTTVRPTHLTVSKQPSRTMDVTEWFTITDYRVSRYRSSITPTSTETSQRKSFGKSRYVKMVVANSSLA